MVPFEGARAGAGTGRVEGSHGLSRGSTSRPKAAIWSTSSSAERDGKRIYLQATAVLSGPEVVAREFGHLKGIADNFPKYVVTLDDGPLNADQDGIVCCSLPAFLRRTDY